VIRPTYGLAEHTVFVCTNGAIRANFCIQNLELNKAVPVSSSDAEDVQTLFGCGIPPSSVTVKIVKDGKQVSHADDVGEIWIASASKAKGYWNHGDETFSASLPDDSNKYLKTGDLGFFYKDELFICGRLKDLIIIRGKNYYPQDLERSLEHLAQGVLRPGCTAAFQSDEVSVTIVAELKDSEAQIDVASLASSLGALYALEAPRIILVKPRTVPKTTSGKISRNATKRKLPQLTILAESKSGVAPTDDKKKKRSAAETAALKKKTKEMQLPQIENILKKLAQKVLGSEEEISIKKNIVEFGLESLQGLHFIAEIDEEFGIDLDPDILFDENLNLSELAQILKFGIPKQRLIVDGISAALAETSKKDTLKKCLLSKSTLTSTKESMRRLELCASLFKRALTSVSLILFVIMLSRKNIFTPLILPIIFVLAVAGPMRVRRRLVFGKDGNRSVIAAATHLQLILTDYNLFKADTTKLIVTFVDDSISAVHLAIATLSYRLLLQSQPRILVSGHLPLTSSALQLADISADRSSQKLVADSLFAHRHVLLLLPLSSNLLLPNLMSRLAQLTKAANAKMIPALQRDNLHIIGDYDDDLDSSIALAAALKKLNQVALSQNGDSPQNNK